MSDEEYVRAVCERLSACLGAFWDVQMAIRANPDDVVAINQKVRPLHLRIQEVRKLVTARLDALAVAHLQTAQGEYGSRFLEDLAFPGEFWSEKGGLEQRYQRLGARSRPLGNLWRLLQEPEPVNVVKECRVRLRGRSARPAVLNHLKRKLTTAQYDVVEALLAASDDGLSKDELATNSKHDDAVNVLKRLAKSDPDWGTVIRLAGKKGGRFRIK
jgi:hypothetical protein